MILRLMSLAFFLTLGLSARNAGALEIYVLTNDNSDTNATNTNFGRIDTTSGAYTSIASLSGDVWNLAWDPALGQFYVSVDFSTALATLTTGGTQSTTLGSTGRVLYAMAYRTNDNTIYGYEWVNNRTGTINPANGAWTSLSNVSGTANSPGGGRYSIMNDTIYFAANGGTGGQLATMPYTAITNYPIITSDNLYSYMALANDGTTLYGIYGNGNAGQQRLYTINTSDGTLTPGPLISGTGLGTYFHGASTTVPEPSALVLFAIAMGLAALLTHRRRLNRRPARA